VRVLVGNHCRRDGMQMDMHQGSNVLLVRQPPDKGWVKLNADDTSKGDARFKCFSMGNRVSNLKWVRAVQQKQDYGLSF